MKNEKTMWVFVFQKYGKFWSISPGYFWRVPPPFQNLTFNFLQTDTGETFMESLLNGLQQHYTQFESLNTNSTSTSYPDCYVVLMCDLYPHVSRNFEKPFSWRNIRPPNKFGGLKTTEWWRRKEGGGGGSLFPWFFRKRFLGVPRGPRVGSKGLPGS